MNIGIVGSGSIVEVFVRNSKKYKDLKLYAIWGRHLEKIQRFEDFKTYYTDIDEFLADKNIDVVYVALPNSLHFEYAYKALKAGKHVLLEKPFCTNYKQAKTLVDYAKAHKLFLYESIMTLHAPNFEKIRKNIDKLGEIKMIDVNFCQYSRRYDKFKQGIVLPAFDYNLAGGALMDLGVYNIYLIVGIFGLPKKVEYYPNMIRKVDTSGVLVLDYGKFKATMVNAKDCQSPSYALIQGDKGYIRLNSTTSRMSDFDVVDNLGNKKNYPGLTGEYAGWDTLYSNFIKIYKKKDLDKCYEYLNYSLLIQKVLDKARLSADIDINI